MILLYQNEEHISDLLRKISVHVFDSTIENEIILSRFIRKTYSKFRSNLILVKYSDEIRPNSLMLLASIIIDHDGKIVKHIDIDNHGKVLTEDLVCSTITKSQIAEQTRKLKEVNSFFIRVMTDEQGILSSTKELLSSLTTDFEFITSYKFRTHKDHIKMITDILNINGYIIVVDNSFCDDQTSEFTIHA